MFSQKCANGDIAQYMGMWMWDKTELDKDCWGSDQKGQSEVRLDNIKQLNILARGGDRSNNSSNSSSLNHHICLLTQQ